MSRAGARFLTRAQSETEALGRRLGRSLRPGDLVLLRGELGAGKTAFIRGAARGAGFRGRVQSPTFALAHRYRASRLTIHHLDLYRLGPGQAGELGLAELLEDPRGAVLVEWPQAARGLWPGQRLEARLAHAREGRRLVFTARGARARELLRALRARAAEGARP